MPVEDAVVDETLPCLREDFWQFRPSHTVILATNHKPTIYGTDIGIWRRIRLIPFRSPDGV